MSDEVNNDADSNDDFYLLAGIVGLVSIALIATAVLV